MLYFGFCYFVSLQCNRNVSCRLQPLFMLHFVEGLPSSDLKGYAFEFGEHWYDIRTVIRYHEQHFSTWMANDDGEYCEFINLVFTDFLFSLPLCQKKVVSFLYISVFVFNL